MMSSIMGAAYAFGSEIIELATTRPGGPPPEGVGLASELESKDQRIKVLLVIDVRR